MPPRPSESAKRARPARDPRERTGHAQMIADQAARPKPARCQPFVLGWG
ncbi:hypothetical protein [Lysobacter gummosus]